MNITDFRILAVNGTTVQKHDSLETSTEDNLLICHKIS